MNQTDYPGINYAPKTSDTNRDPITKIRYGVISHADVGQAWYDGAEPVYPDEIECYECRATVQLDCETCPKCAADLYDTYDLDPEAWVYQDNDYHVEQSQDSPDLFVIKSPYVTYAQFCSPCAPGACYLTNPLTKPALSNICYCLGPDWFDGKPPYPIYSVETGERI
jgi:hypothetical protein